MPIKKTTKESASIIAHRKLAGKIETRAKARLTARKDLSLYYTPGVAEVSRRIAEHPEEAKTLTTKGNTIAVISDGSAVLGLGNIGPLAALPVMEGKAMIFKEFAGVNAFPLVLSTQDPKEIIAAVAAVAPGFAGINLEDISAPRCFEVERALRAMLPIPVFHDDQHGTAIAVLAGLLNALSVTKRKIGSSRIAVVGAGAAGNAITHILSAAGAGDVVVVDSKGIVSKDRTDLDPYKKELLSFTNPRNIRGGVEEALRGADVLIGVSKGNILTGDHVRSMAKNPIIFALSNPTPEVDPAAAAGAGAAVIATGRSDMPNQINNALVFPGLFRALLRTGAPNVTDEMKTATAHAIAKLVAKPTAKNIIPSVFDTRIVPTIEKAVRKAMNKRKS